MDSQQYQDELEKTLDRLFKAPTDTGWKPPMTYWPDHGVVKDADDRVVMFCDPETWAKIKAVNQTQNLDKAKESVGLAIQHHEKLNRQLRLTSAPGLRKAMRLMQKHLIEAREALKKLD